MAHSSASLALFAPSGVWATKGRCLATVVAPAPVELDNINYDLHRSNEDPDVCILYKSGKHLLMLRRFRIALHEGIPTVLPEVLESEMDLRHWFDGYEDGKKVEEKSWHASFASTNMVMQAY
jgi:hypothetical protein